MKKAIGGGNGILACLTAFFVVCIWGTTFVQTKVLINAGLHPEEIFLFRFLLAYLFIIPFACKEFKIDLKEDPN
jgi:drug/metabolite transporter (DMT)-like permease